MSLTVTVLLASGGVLIGALLSLLGAGGSILLLPLLVSGAGLAVIDAMPLALLVVLLLALLNVPPYLRRGQIALKPGLILGLPSLLGSWITASWVRQGLVSEQMQLMVFSLAALAATWLLNRPANAHASQRQSGPGVQGLQGLAVGALTGIAGVGGGFAMVPALVLLAGLPMATASGTSLILIGLNGVMALVALGHWPAEHLNLLTPLLLGGALGAWIGQRLAPYAPEVWLRRGFSTLLLMAAALSGFEAWSKHRLEEPAMAANPPHQPHKPYQQLPKKWLS